MTIEQFRNEFWYMMKAVKHGAAEILSPILESSGLTKLQACVLLGIKDKQFNTIGCLSENLLQNQGNASTICKKLEKENLITRTRSVGDERVVYLSLTQEGKEKIRGVEEQFEIMFAAYKNKAGSEECFDKIITGFAELNKLVNEIKNSV